MGEMGNVYKTVVEEPQGQILEGGGV